MNFNTETEEEKAIEDLCKKGEKMYARDKSKDTESADQIREAGLGNDAAQVRSASLLAPPMPPVPNCKGKDCVPEANPLDGDPNGVGPGTLSKNKWNPSRPAIKGGVEKPLMTAMDELEHLGKTLVDKYDEMKSKHIRNQAQLGTVNEMLHADAEASYAKRMVATNTFADKLVEFKKITADAGHAWTLYQTKAGDKGKNMDELKTKTSEFLEKLKVMSAKSISDIDLKKKEFQDRMTILEPLLETKLKLKCKAAMKKKVNEIKSILSNLESNAEELKGGGVTDLEEYYKEAVTELETVASDTKPIEEKLAKATETFTKATTDAVANIKAAQEKMLKKFEEDTAGMDVKTTANGDVSTEGVNNQADISLEKDLATGKTTASIKGVDGQESTKSMDGEVMKQAETNEQAPELLLSLNEFAVLRAQRLAGDAGDAGAAAAAKGAGDGAAAKKNLQELTAGVSSIVEGHGVIPSNSLDTSKFSSAMTHVDTMVTSLKDALDCLKEYLLYYQAGASQVKKEFKTEHEEITKVILEGSASMMAAMMDLKNLYRQLTHEAGKSRVAANKFKLFIDEELQPEFESTETLTGDWVSIVENFKPLDKKVCENVPDMPPAPPFVFEKTSDEFFKMSAMDNEENANDDQKKILADANQILANLGEEEKITKD